MSEQAGERRPEVAGVRPEEQSPEPRDPTSELPVPEPPPFQMMGDSAGVCIDGVCQIPDESPTAATD